MITKRYNEANNRYLIKENNRYPDSQHDKIKQDIYIQYRDANNLNG